MEMLKKEVLKTLAFYDIFGYPLTPLEIYKGLGVKAEFADILPALEELLGENKIIKESGYFFLPQDLLKNNLVKGADLAEKRKARFLISLKKAKRAARIGKILSLFPFVKFIAVCNSLGFLNASEESDIDIFVITKAGRIWTARFLIAGFLRIFNLRPALGATKDRICASFFISEDNLCLRGMLLPGGDPYFCHWLAWLLPLHDEKIYKKFLEANAWIKEYLPNFIPQDAYKHKSAMGRIFRAVSRRLLGRGFENFVKRIQLNIMPEDLKNAAGRGDNSVIISDSVLKFHLLDRREEYRMVFRDRTDSQNFIK